MTIPTPTLTQHLDALFDRIYELKATVDQQLGISLETVRAQITAIEVEAEGVRGALQITRCEAQAAIDKL